MDSNKKVGLVLGGGGARGWAHVGVLRALEEHDVPIHCVAGTSIGALIGAIYIVGALDKLEEFADKIDTQTLMSLLDISFPGLGIVDGHKVKKFLYDYLVDAQIENARMPFRCVATNFSLKQEVVFESGSMVDAVRASISLPGIFVPVKHENGYLVDGGVINPVPVNVAQAMGADVVIAVNLNHDHQAEGDRPHPSQQSSTAPSSQTDEDESSATTTTNTQGTPDLIQRYQNVKEVVQDQIDDWMPDPSSGINIFDVLGNSINLMEQQVTRVRLETEIPDVLIEPHLMQYGIFDFTEAQPMIQEGYDRAQAAMPQIRHLLANTD